MPLLYTSRSFSFNLYYVEDENKTLLNKTVEHAQLTKFQNFSRKNVKLNYSSKSISFSGSSSNIKRILFFHNSLGTLPLRLIYWDKSIQRVDTIITTKWIPGTTPKIIEKFPKRQIWGRCVIEWTSHFDMNVFPRVVWILSQVTSLHLHVMFWNLKWQTSMNESLLNGYHTSIFTW